MDYERIQANLFETLLAKSFEVEADEEEAADYYLPPLDDEEHPALPILDDEDRLIIMHRDAHFGGSFPVMLEYYLEEGKGAVLDVDTKRIESLALLEEQLGRNLAPLLLSGSDAELIARSRKYYKELRKFYEGTQDPLATALADLILSEADDPHQDALAIAKQGKKAIPLLLRVLDTQELHQDIFPGFGLAPVAAALALGELKAEEAIQPLFELIGTTNFELESAAIEALGAIGDKARTFCVKVFRSRPITSDNERALIALLPHAHHQDVRKALQEALQDPEVQKQKSLVEYLNIVEEQ